VATSHQPPSGIERSPYLAKRKKRWPGSRIWKKVAAPHPIGYKQGGKPLFGSDVRMQAAKELILCGTIPERNCKTGLPA
jgi:hypothetical protein